MPRKTTATNAQLRAAKNIRKQIGARIADRRKEVGLNQNDLAFRFGVSRAALSQFEVGIGEINAGDMPFLAEILDAPVTYFYGNAREVTTSYIDHYIRSVFPRLSNRDKRMVIAVIDHLHDSDFNKMIEDVDGESERGAYENSRAAHADYADGKMITPDEVDDIIIEAKSGSG